MKLFRKSKSSINFLDYDVEKEATKLYVKELFIEHAIDLISKTVGKLNFNYYKDGKPASHDINYMLNIKPNKNQTASVFWSEVTKQLLYESEALVIVNNKQLYLAETFDTSESVLTERKYIDIKLKDERGNVEEFKKTVKAKDAIYLNLGSSKMNGAIEKFNEEIGKLLVSAYKSNRRSNSIKAKLTLPQQVVQLKDQDGNDVTLKQYVDKMISGLYSDDDSVVSLGSSFNLEMLDPKNKQSSDDVTKLIKSIGDYTAMSFGIPLDIFYGNKTEKSTSIDDLLSFAIMPIISIIQESLNAAFINREDYGEKEKIVINKYSLQYFNILTIAGSIDKLRSIGYSYNDIQKYLGEPTVDEDWANARYITKNYMDVENADELTEKKGGD